MAEQEEQTDESAPDEATGEVPQADDETAEEAPQEEPEDGGADVVAEQAVLAEDVLEAEEEDQGRRMRKERVGVVVSDKMDKTIVVSIERSTKHPMYKKYLTRSARKMTHDENDDAGEGDTVRIMETRPISKHKRWRLVEILERAA